MLVLKNVSLVDVKANQLLKNQVIIVKNGRISAIGEALPIAQEAEVLDCAGKFVMPGLMDMHVHLGGSSDPAEPVPIGGRKLRGGYENALGKLLEHGITTIRSAGDYSEDIIQTRDLINSGKAYGPRILAPGRVFQALGGHPGFTVWGASKELTEAALCTADTPYKAREEVKKIADRGADHIKAFLTDIDIPNFPKKAPKLSIDVLNAIGDEARIQNLKLMVHAHSPQDALSAVRAGATSVEHIIQAGTDSLELPSELIDEMLAAGVFVVFTLVIIKRHDGLNPLMPKIYNRFEEIAGEIYSAGVKIAAGSDSGVPHVDFGEALHSELELMTRAGISNVDVIRSATINSAVLAGIQSETGSLEEGKIADILILSGNPLQNVSETRNILNVIKSGKIIR